MKLGVLLDRWQPSESVVMGGAALLVGISAGAGIWIFKRLIDISSYLFFEQLGSVLAPLGGWSVLLLPILGGLIVGWIMHLFVGEERHHGVAGIIESVAISGGRLRYWRLPAKVVASALSIGAGAAVGPEDPSVQIGSNFGSMFGQLLHLSDERVRVLVAAGAAAGIASAFKAPIAGVFFALEIIMVEMGSSALGVMLLSAVTASVFTQAITGSVSEFTLPPYAFDRVLELPLYLGLGLILGPLAVLYVRLLYMSHDLFHHLHLPRWLKPALAGLLVGVIGIWLPQVFGVGYETIQSTLTGELSGIALLIALSLAKTILTPVSIGGGFQGGVFAPSLFIGAVLGSAYGALINLLFPGLGVAPPTYAMVGMAAMLAAAVHAPLTAILLLFELTNDYRIILPLMAAVVVSLTVARWLNPDSVYSLGLARKGIRIERGRDIEVLDSITVSEVMSTKFATLAEADIVRAASERLMRSRSHGLPVVDVENHLVGIVTVQDIDRAQDKYDPDKTTVGEICTRQLLVAYPDETIGTALRRMSVRDIGRLPVVDRNDQRELVGILRRTDLVRAYDLALTRRSALRHQAQQIRLGAISQTDVEQIIVKAGAECMGRRISEITWPRSFMVASIRRGRTVLVPHGDTVLQEGDVLAVIGDGEALRKSRQICGEL